MKLLNKIVATPDTIAHSKGDILTIEERQQLEFENFKTDAGATIVGAMGSLVSGIALNVASMFSLSSRSEIRQKYGLLHDYTQEPNVCAACNSITSAVRKYEQTLGEFVKDLSRMSRISVSIKADAGDNFISRCDASDDEFAADYERIRKAIYEKFKPCKCSDPQAFYRLMYALFLSRRFNAISEYISMYSQGFGKGEPLFPMTKMHVTEHLQNLMRRCNFCNKEQQPFIFLFTKEERLEFDVEKQRKSWQKKHEGLHPVELDIWQLFSDDDIVKPVWLFETHLMELKTIDKLILQSEGHDPEYRKDYKMRRIQSCAETYEQSMLVSTICCYRWNDFPLRMRNYLDSRKAVRSIDSRRIAKPVAMFDVKRKQNGEIFMQFHGIWNSVNEAEREMQIKASCIRKSVNQYANDGYNHIWMSIEEYCAISYHTLLEQHPEVAVKFCELITEFDLKEKTIKHVG